MKTTIRFFVSVFALCFAVGFAGCGDDTSNGTAADMTATVHDLATGTVHDMAPIPTDDAGLRLLAAPCSSNADCESGFCGTYMMGAEKLCSFMCTKNMPAPQCTSPGNGQCNGMGECQFPGMN